LMLGLEYSASDLVTGGDELLTGLQGQDAAVAEGQSGEQVQGYGRETDPSGEAAQQAEGEDDRAEFDEHGRGVVHGRLSSVGWVRWRRLCPGAVPVACRWGRVVAGRAGRWMGGRSDGASRGRGARRERGGPGPVGPRADGSESRGSPGRGPVGGGREETGRSRAGRFRRWWWRGVSAVRGRGGGARRCRYRGGRRGRRCRHVWGSPDPCHAPCPCLTGVAGLTERCQPVVVDRPGSGRSTPTGTAPTAPGAEDPALPEERTQRSTNERNAAQRSVSAWQKFYRTPYRDALGQRFTYANEWIADRVEYRRHHVPVTAAPSGDRRGTRRGRPGADHPAQGPAPGPRHRPRAVSGRGAPAAPSHRRAGAEGRGRRAARRCH